MWTTYYHVCNDFSLEEASIMEIEEIEEKIENMEAIETPYGIVYQIDEDESALYFFGLSGHNGKQLDDVIYGE